MLNYFLTFVNPLVRASRVNFINFKCLFIPEVQCSVSSQVQYQIQAFWGVNIRELHIFLWRPWSDLREALQRGDFLKGFYQYPGIQLK